MNETDFLSQYDPGAFQRPSVTVDLVLLGLRENRPSVLLVRRDQHPHAGRWALPGGFVGIDESLDAAAARVLREKAGMGEAHLEQLYTFGAVDRDPRMRIISVAYLALLTEQAFDAAHRAMPALLPAAIHVPWAGEAGGPVDVLSPENETLTLAFDHAEILAMAMLRLRGKLDYSDVAFALLPDLFTLRQLQDLHEAVLGTALNKPAFRRRQLDKGWLAATGAYESGTAFRPAELYRFRRLMAD
ncbi:NUDIX domain-containing protein [Mesorhizobium sp.]|uniref:NUDIX hydrolase n=1 Tax=Mesorhizobium sp. TaxID=1871066 RepID=UPI000FE33EC8|nr:NUDIX domain-containing protein [Mesorhizobium sp.]RWA72039.1 MAG: NUDIX domain-containing protein [Mesorhizobium sp.]RWC05427.1 MAG: NUDIX domain-containing protein [Mesorhizobium sp.]RWG84284.1 MAG: NUDIX domain-containing protein [Mesorhizobium sp.]RWG89452.1 MAG: NUDIX domain-containing protein [Mesorhizobium sp.]RWK07760.1 MAG: NUDIX domain-containing protein [Mesorhizobium sp.]